MLKPVWDDRYMKCGGSACPGCEEPEVAGSSCGKLCGWLEIEAADAVAALVCLSPRSPANLSWLTVRISCKMLFYSCSQINHCPISGERKSTGNSDEVVLAFVRWKQVVEYLRFDVFLNAQDPNSWASQSSTACSMAGGAAGTWKIPSRHMQTLAIIVFKLRSAEWPGQQNWHCRNSCTATCRCHLQNPRARSWTRSWGGSR